MSQPEQQNPDTPKKPGKRKKIIGIVILVLALSWIVNQCSGGNSKTEDSAPSFPTTTTQAQSSAPAWEETPQSSSETSGDVTSGGIDYGHAVQACNDAAKEQLFPGATYDSHEILGKQKGQVGLSDDQYLAVYNVEVDGRKTAVTCLVDGTKDDINVVSVKETEAQ